MMQGFLVGSVVRIGFPRGRFHYLLQRNLARQTRLCPTGGTSITRPLG